MSSKFPHGGDKPAHHATFEETYPRYEFAELVRLTVAAAAWLAAMRRRVEAKSHSFQEVVARGENPAE